MLSKLIAVIAVLLLASLLAVAGCTVILPESPNAPHNTTTKVASNGNLTISVQTLLERQRYSVSQIFSYSAKEGYKLAVYDVNITNLDGPRQAGNTTFFAVTAGNGTTYQAALNTLSPQVMGQGGTLQGQVVFEVPLNATPRSLTYDDGVTRIVTSQL